MAGLGRPRVRVWGLRGGATRGPVGDEVVAGAARVDRPGVSARARRPGPRIKLLGGFTAIRREREIHLPAASQRLVALAALHGRPIRRSLAAERIWPHLTPTSARGSLRTAIARLRATDAHLVSVERDRLALHESVDVDVRETEALARTLIAGSSTADPWAISIEPLTLPLLPTFDDDWVLLERDRLQDLCLHALEAHARRLSAGRAFGPALAAIHAALAVDPLRESAVHTLIEIHLAERNQVSAVRAYQQFRERLRVALDVAPSSELRALLG